jgi:hypothetical protein
LRSTGSEIALIRSTSSTVGGAELSLGSGDTAQSIPGAATGSLNSFSVRLAAAIAVDVVRPRLRM